ncbi:hypothetical protein, conserved [Eimeria tenella]|uniref:RNase III domain-containing protein n=1 Tax=Eimeria tenella TaxID=5802 RepID=U6L724_EIMTE|nr:hypothetical protein, conserved [Eimeria tenella]CDJ43590.1 hypothetical protein, conserved [Eimeria tenella]|eukprot:XP_013234340.1 hypothetical protein, conserved [Eimeria tenella]
MLSRPFIPAAALAGLREQVLSPKMLADAMEAITAAFYLSNRGLLGGPRGPSEAQQGPMQAAPLGGPPQRSQGPPGSFRGLLAAAAFIGQFVLQGGPPAPGKGPQAHTGAGESQEPPERGLKAKQLPPVVNVLSAAAAVSAAICCGPPLSPQGTSRDPKDTFEQAEEEDFLCTLLLPAGVPHTPLHPDRRVAVLLQQLLRGPREGSSKPQAAAIPASCCSSSGAGSSISEQTVSDLWLAPARDLLNCCYSQEALDCKTAAAFWKERGLCPRLVALARSAEVPGVPQGSPQGGPQENYQLLEFLGDSALSLLVSEWLFWRFPEAREGPLTMARSILVSNAFFAAKMIRRLHAAGVPLDSLIVESGQGAPQLELCLCLGPPGDGACGEGPPPGSSLLACLWQQAEAAGCGLRAGGPCCCCCRRCSSTKKKHVVQRLVQLPPEEDFAREAAELISRLTLPHNTPAAAAAAAAQPRDDSSSSSSSNSSNAPKWIKQLGDVYESLASAALLSSGFSLEALWAAVAADFESCMQQVESFTLAVKGLKAPQVGPLPDD